MLLQPYAVLLVEHGMQLLQLLVACQDKADAGAVHKGDLFKIKLYRFGLIFFYQVDADLLEIANGKVIQIPVKIKVKDTVNILMFHVSSLRPSSYHVFICLWGYSTKHPEVRQNKLYPSCIRTKLAVYRKPLSRIISAISQNRYAKAPMSLSYIDKRNVLEK